MSLLCVVKVDISITLVILYIVGYDRRRPELSNAPLKGRCDNHGTKRSHRAKPNQINQYKHLHAALFLENEASLLKMVE